MIMNTRDKEITDQPRLKSFRPEMKFNLQHIRRSLSPEVTSVGHKSKRAKTALASDLLRKTIITLRAFK